MIIQKKSDAYIKLEDVSLHLPVIGDSNTKSNYKVKNASVGSKIEHINGKNYIRALKNVSLDFQSGSKIAVLGHNGAGKTSLLRILSGIYQPTMGRRRIKGKLSALFSSTIGLNMHSTGVENTRYACALYGFDHKEIDSIIEDVREFSELGNYMDLPLRTYSMGMRTRLGFSIITSVKPDILIIDEVLSAGDFSFAKKIGKRMHDVLQKAELLIVASHSAALMRMFCTEAICMSQGEIVMSGGVEEILTAYQEQAKNK